MERVKEEMAAKKGGVQLQQQKEEEASNSRTTMMVNMNMNMRQIGIGIGTVQQQRKAADNLVSFFNRRKKSVKKASIYLEESPFHKFAKHLQGTINLLKPNKQRCMYIYVLMWVLYKFTD
jgi:hypothetical protein